MRFSQVEALLFWWPVRCNVPDPDKPGATVEQAFEAQFLQLSDAAMQDAAKDDRTFMAAALQGARKIEDDEGRPVPFSAELAERLIANPLTRTALFAAYYEGLSGVRRKN